MVPAVPAQFLGLARAYRARLAAQDADTASRFDAVAGALRSCLMRRPTVRPERLTDAARAWQNNTGPGRLRLEIVKSTKTLDVREIRVTAAVGRFDGWAKDVTEPGIAIIGLQLEVGRRRFRFDDAMLVGLSLHALARRFQRGFDNSAGALAEDFRALAAMVTDTVLDSGGGVEIAVSGGRWAGVVMETAPGARVLAVRTFLSAKEP
jgi:hypothetical protein